MYILHLLHPDLASCNCSILRRNSYAIWIYYHVLNLKQKSFLSIYSTLIRNALWKGMHGKDLPMVARRANVNWLGVGSWELYTQMATTNYTGIGCDRTMASAFVRNRIKRNPNNIPTKKKPTEETRRHPKIFRDLCRNRPFTYMLVANSGGQS